MTRSEEERLGAAIQTIMNGPKRDRDDAVREWRDICTKRLTDKGKVVVTVTVEGEALERLAFEAYTYDSAKHELISTAPFEIVRQWVSAAGHCDVEPLGGVSARAAEVA